MKPLKKWQPVYRFGGNPTDICVPPLGTTVRVPKPKKVRRKKK